MSVVKAPDRCMLAACDVVDGRYSINATGTVMEQTVMVVVDMPSVQVFDMVRLDNAVTCN